MLELDHLVVAAPTLEAGVAHVAESLGLAPKAFSAIGKHAAMGTHNRLLNLYGHCYLEVIAIDPQAPAPQRARWFGLDDPAVQQRLAYGPMLLHWVARLCRPRDLSRLAQQYPERVPPVLAMTRDIFSWRIAVPEDGALPGCEGIGGDGLTPTLIQWDGAHTPAQALPASDLALRRLTGFHPRAQQIRMALAALGAQSLIEIEDTLIEPSLAAEIETPTGIKVLK